MDDRQQQSFGGIKPQASIKAAAASYMEVRTNRNSKL